MNKMFDTVFGTDPEVFIVNDGGWCIPPVALKEDYNLDYLRAKTLLEDEDWKIIEDGAATEINIAPSDNVSEIFDRLGRAYNAVQKLAESFKLKAVVYPTVPFDLKKYWQKRGENFRDCVRFGCDPDLDIYSGEYSVETDSSKIPERYGGGHIHMQAPLNNPTLFEEIFYHATRLMDILVGNTGVAINRPSNDWVEAEKSRLKYYGRPGKIRLQDYGNNLRGIEYRVPSNFWITDDKIGNALLTLMNSVYNLCLNPSDASEILNSGDVDNIPKNILTFDTKRAKSTAHYIMDRLAHLRYINYDDYVNILELIT